MSFGRATPQVVIWCSRKMIETRDAVGAKQEQPAIEKPVCESRARVLPKRSWPPSTHSLTRMIHERFCCNRRCLTQARRARLAGKARRARVDLVHLVCLVCSVYLVRFVYLVYLVYLVCLVFLLRYLMRPEMILPVLSLA